jgi:hypothetical protein
MKREPILFFEKDDACFWFAPEELSTGREAEDAASDDREIVEVDRGEPPRQPVANAARPDPRADVRAIDSPRTIAARRST